MPGSHRDLEFDVCVPFSSPSPDASLKCSVRTYCGLTRALRLLSKGVPTARPPAEGLFLMGMYVRHCVSY